MCQSLVFMSLLNVSQSRYLSEHNIRTALLSTPGHKIPTIPPQKHPQDRINTPKTLTSTPQHLRVSSHHQRSKSMSVAYSQAQKQRYRITLDIQAFPDFDPHQIDWEKLFKLEPAEKCDAYVEDLNTPDRW